ncbi:MAG: hypothetical protein HYZ74_00025 [Elusimicrobia bacterium]|nr:hypothetical protein [Elusimicrobiota bacterium]
MKIKTTLGAILPLLFAVTASAQLKLIPGGRGNLLIGLPLALPSPVSNPVINPRIELPGFPVQITPATPIPTTLPSLSPASPLILRNGNVSGRVSPLVRSLRLRM